MFFSADVWSPAFCREVRAAMDRGSAAPAEIIHDGGYVVDRRVRHVLDIEVAEETLKAVEAKVTAARAEVASFFGLSLSRSEGPGFLRYRPGGFYRRHRDRSSNTAAIGERLVSLVVFLNSGNDGADPEGFGGGALRLYPREGAPPVDVQPRAGLIVAFPADMPHEALTVTGGVRDVVVDWYL